MFLNDVLIQKFVDYINFTIVSLNAQDAAEKYKVA